MDSKEGSKVSVQESKSKSRGASKKNNRGKTPILNDRKLTLLNEGIPFGVQHVKRNKWNQVRPSFYNYSFYTPNISNPSPIIKFPIDK